MRPALRVGESLTAAELVKLAKRERDARVCPATGACNSWLMPTANTDTMNIQLKDMSQQVESDVQVLLILDQAGRHSSHGLKVPQNITPLRLPPYSPLNPVELIWRHLRRHHLSNRRYLDHEANRSPSPRPFGPWVADCRPDWLYGTCVSPVCSAGRGVRSH